MRRGLAVAAVLLGAIAPAGARDNPTVICPAGSIIVRTDDGFDKCVAPEALTAPRFGFALWAPLRDRRRAR